MSGSAVPDAAERRTDVGALAARPSRSSRERQSSTSCSGAPPGAAPSTTGAIDLTPKVNRRRGATPTATATATPGARARPVRDGRDLATTAIVAGIVIVASLEPPAAEANAEVRLQRRSDLRDRAAEARSAVPPLPRDADGGDEAEYREAHGCKEGCGDRARDVETRTGVRSDEHSTSSDIARPGFSGAPDSASRACGRGHESKRRARFEGEYQLCFWSRPRGTEAPAIGYAPSEYRRIRWSHEAPREGWFPTPVGERRALSIAEDAEERWPAPKRMSCGARRETPRLAPAEDGACVNLGDRAQPEALSSTARSAEASDAALQGDEARRTRQDHELGEALRGDARCPTKRDPRGAASVSCPRAPARG